MHVSRSVVAGQVLIACEDDTSDEDLLDIHFALVMRCEKIVGVLDCLHVLHKCKVIRASAEDGSRAFESFVHGAQSENAMFDGRFDMAQLQHLLAPQV